MLDYDDCQLCLIKGTAPKRRVQIQNVVVGHLFPGELAPWPNRTTGAGRASPPGEGSRRSEGEARD